MVDRELKQTRSKPILVNRPVRTAHTTVHQYKYRNGLLPMQYVFLIRSSAGCKKYVTRRNRVSYFLPPARERIKNTYCISKRPFIFLLLIYNILQYKIFNNILRKNPGTLLYYGRIVRHYDSERVWGVCS